MFSKQNKNHEHSFSRVWWCKSSKLKSRRFRQEKQQGVKCVLMPFASCLTLTPHEASMFTSWWTDRFWNEEWRLFQKLVCVDASCDVCLMIDLWSLIHAKFDLWTLLFPVSGFMCSRKFMFRNKRKEISLKIFFQNIFRTSVIVSREFSNFSLSFLEITSLWMQDNELLIMLLSRV